MKNLYDFLIKSGVKPKDLVNVYETVRSLELVNGFTFNGNEVKLIISSCARFPNTPPGSIHHVSKV